LIKESSMLNKYINVVGIFKKEIIRRDTTLKFPSLNYATNVLIYLLNYR